MGRAVWLLLAALGSVCLALECPCNYAANVTWPDAAHCMFFWEGRIWELASWPELALTKDGHFFDPRDGSVDASPPHNFSAASKESLHLAVLARALEGDVDAGVFVVAPNCHALAYPYDKCVVVAKRMGVSAALATLDRKMAALERWTREFRGFGGFLPWFSVNDSVHLVPQTGWEQRVPALDNGEFVWALVACSEALRSVSHPRGTRMRRVSPFLPAHIVQHPGCNSACKRMWICWRPTSCPCFTTTLSLRCAMCPSSVIPTAIPKTLPTTIHRRSVFLTTHTKERWAFFFFATACRHSH